ncbi:hypothetical protein VMCG_08602 [Cytospora schulzeri]|uniref:Mitochondrial carrier protein n=1 Tax=Cytospora schulzeri TaxID=448051 RepID=A0A423VVW9_9PEZI|nr:hypothetical protein VMCG_08602 [Valsa malicola]
MPSNKSIQAGLDLIKKDPSKVLGLTVGKHNITEPGQYVPRSDAQSPPQLTLPSASSSKSYVVIALDLDAPFPSFDKLGPILHWAQSGLKVAISTEASAPLEMSEPFIANYIGPAPPPGSSPHRYVFFLYEQPDVFDGVKKFAPKDGKTLGVGSRMWASLDEWEKKLGLGEAGAAAAFTVDLLVYPLDTIKTRYQSQDYLKTFARSGTVKQAPTNVFRGLYQGVGSVIIATLPAAGIFFTTYEASKTFYSGLSRHLPDGFALPTPVVHSLSSGTAELASCIVLTPAEVIKQNAQMIRSSGTHNTTSTGRGGWRNSTSIQALRMISNSGGLYGAAHRLLTGYTALAARNLPFTALQFPMFEGMRRRLWEWRDARNDAVLTVKDGSGGVGGGERKVESGALARGLLETGGINGASAAVSGAIAAGVTAPTDVVKTRMMLFAGEERAARKEAGDKAAAAGKQGQERHDTQKRLERAARRQQLSGMQVAKLVYQERGVKGLFRGGLLRAGWTALGSGLYLGTYEVAKVWLKGSSEGVEDEGI